MKTTYRLITLFLYVLLAVPTTFAQQAQDKPIEARTQDVTIIIQQEHVRFTSQKAVQMMQLQIFNQAGEQVYDSGPMTVPEINWPLQAANGGALKSGLYAYTLTLQESDASTARARRGHFIVDRVQDRDSKTDKLWVTSQNDSSIGTELTVARNDSGTVAGTSTTSDRASARTSTTERETTQREVAGRSETKSASAKDQPKLEAANGTIGQIAKFTSGTDLGNSVMTEKNGNIGIGTVTPESPLHVHGASGIISSGSGGAFFFRNRETTTATDYWGWYSQGNVARFWRQGVGDLLSVTTNGNVGIGTTTPQSKLTVQGGGYGLSHTAGAVTVGSYIPLQAGLSGGSGWFGTKSNHPLHFFTNDGLPQMTLETSGNVGIGTDAPTTRLYVLSRTPGISAIFAESATGRGVWGKSTSSRGVYGESVSNVGVWGVSSNSTGVVGQSTYGYGVDGNSASPDGFGGHFTNTGGGKALRVDGTGSLSVLEITGGSDLAEKFEVEDETKPGMVVAIDPRNGGRLAISRKAYNRRVAGIISGANNLSVGMVLPDLADSKNAQPVALSGRVWVYCDATKSPIKPGDLLTTSATPGHAMKVGNSAKAQGAIIGKAMTGLKSGKGLILVLVTLQ